MKVRQLIEELERCDPEREVLIDVHQANFKGEYIENSVSGNDTFLNPEGVDDETVMIQGEIFFGLGKYEKLADEYKEEREVILSEEAAAKEHLN